MKLKRIFLLIFICWGKNLSAQNNIVFQPDSILCENAVIWDLFPNDPRPNDILFQGSAWTLNGTPEIYRSLLKFDLSVIPMNAIVDSAFITFFGFVDAFNGHSNLSGSNESVIQQIASAWNENSVTWNNQPTTITSNQINLQASSFPGQDYFDYNITDMVQFWVNNPLDNYGFMYKLQQEQYYRRMSFYSPASNDSIKRPLLYVYYSIPSGINSVVQNKFEIYPNPSNGHVSISISDIDNLTISIYDMYLNKIDYSADYFAQKINLHIDNGTGVYFIEIKNNNTRILKKVILM